MQATPNELKSSNLKDIFSLRLLCPAPTHNPFLNLAGLPAQRQLPQRLCHLLTPADILARVLVLCNAPLSRTKPISGDLPWAYRALYTPIYTEN